MMIAPVSTSTALVYWS